MNLFRGILVALPLALALDAVIAFVIYQLVQL